MEAQPTRKGSDGSLGRKGGLQVVSIVAICGRLDVEVTDDDVRCLNFRLAPPTICCHQCDWAKYCSSECQWADWVDSQGHQEECDGAAK